MRTAVQKPPAIQQSKPAAATKTRPLLSERRRDLYSALQTQSTNVNQATADSERLEVAPDPQRATGFGHDFSRISVQQKDIAPTSGADQNVAPAAGEPLPSTTRARLESILGTRLGDVRLHRGSAAERAAAAVGAPAFTVGQDIVLGASAAQPETGQRSSSAGERLLAHEAAHTVQQSNATGPALQLVDSAFGSARPSWPRTTPDGAEERQAEAASRGLERPTAGAPLAIAAAPPASLPFTPLKSFKELWPKFEQARYAFDLGQATALARELATAPHDFDDLLKHGIDLVNWLQHNGEPALAAQMLDDVRSVWMIQFSSLNSPLPGRGALSWGSSDPRVLITLGKEAARAGQHDQAFSLFGVANEILSYYALEASEHRMNALEKENDKAAQARESGKDPDSQLDPNVQALPRLIGRSTQYTDLKDIYDQMRDIYGFYGVLERESLAAGDTKAAAEARGRSAKLHEEIKEKYTWGGVQGAGKLSQEIAEPVEIAEVGYTETPKGPGLTLYGANSAETTLTPLPGLPAPKEVGNNVQVQNLGTLQGALMAQTDFQAEIGRQPEIRRAFGDKPIDLNDTAQRQKVWQIMYGVYQQAGTGALGSLLALVGRYLQAFTIHTMYNVRDWGQNYLDSELPTDLAGRAEKDCGVYALTVAWDVYQTVKHADAKLNVTFDLTTMLEHVTLVITDQSTGEYYVVNNDQISPPQHGDPRAQVARQYGAVRGLPYTVGPSATVGVGSTQDAPKAFHDNVWTRYLAAVDWGLGLDIPPETAQLEKTNPAAYAQKVLAIQHDRYESFYRDQEIFDRETKALDPLVDALAPVAGDGAKLAVALEPLVDKAGALAVRFIRLGPSSGMVAGSAKSLAVLPKNQQYLFTLQEGHTTHPMVRVALGILHLKALGGTPTPKEDALVQFCAKVPLFQQQMDAYQAAGATGRF